MPYRIKAPETQRFPLTGIDPSGDTYVEIKQATQHAVERRAAATESRTHVMGEGKNAVRVESRFNYPEVQRFEAFLTMTGCNIEDPNGESLFKFETSRSGMARLDMDEDEFEVAWGRLDPDAADEIHNAVLAVNPMWSFESKDDEDF